MPHKGINMFKLILCGAVSGLLCSCASVGGTADIVPIGQDTYMVASAGGLLTFSGGEVKAQLFQEANRFCRSKGKNLMPVTSSSRDAAPYTYASAELQFRCLADGDPGLRRPTMINQPDVTIQMQK